MSKHRRHRKFKVDRDAVPYKGRYAPYDLVKEGVIALLVRSILTVGRSVIFSSPDERAVTIKDWVTSQPTDFVTTAASELNASSGSAQYGPPYNNGPNVQKLGPFALPKIFRVRIRTNTARNFTRSQ